MALEYTALHEACAKLDVGHITTISPLTNVLDEHSKALALEISIREQIGCSQPSIWPHLQRVWSMTASAHTFNDDEDNERRSQLRKLCFSLSRFTRNLVAAVPENQKSAFENEPAIRSLCRYYTSYSATQDTETYPVTRVLVQTLSNLVTTNEELMSSLWDSYLKLPEEQLILIRLFSVPDAKTALSTFILVLNCLEASKTRMRLLTSSPSGLRLCIALFDRIASLYDEEDSADSSQAFEIGYRIFCRITEQGSIPSLYERISMKDEIITPHQTTLLKLLDSYLQPAQAHAITLTEKTLTELCVMLISTFFALSLYAQHSIKRALGSDVPRSLPPSLQAATELTQTIRPASLSTEPTPPEELDLLLPKVSEALVLVTQCLISLALYSEESTQSSSLRPPEGATASLLMAGQLKDFVATSISASGHGAIECLIETLRLFDRFLPRITFGKVAPVPVPAPESGMPQDQAQLGAEAARVSDPKGFAYLKRDLVRLLGILSSDRPAVQDRVRACGGIPVVLNLCVVDDRNPYLREHAIFTLRNLLHGNLENQALVNEIQPLREWDKSGLLQARGHAA